MREFAASNYRRIDIPELKSEGDIFTAVHDPDIIPQRVNGEIGIVQEEQIVFQKVMWFLKSPAHS